jgi:hypothetical protein
MKLETDLVLKLILPFDTEEEVYDWIHSITPKDFILNHKDKIEYRFVYELLDD